MTNERAPVSERSLAGDTQATTSWEFAVERLENPEVPRTCWLATARPDGRPHLMPVIAFWIDGALHIVAGEGTRKARNLAADGRCVIGTSSTRLPSLDLVVEGRADPLPISTPSDASPSSSPSTTGRSRPRGTRFTDRTRQPPVRRRTRSSGSSRRRCSVCRACTGWTSSTRRTCRNRRAGNSVPTEIRRSNGSVQSPAEVPSRSTVESA